MPAHISGSPSHTTQSAVEAAIGRTANQSNNFFDGSIDDVRVYSRALTPAEVKQLYKLGTVIIRR